MTLRPADEPHPLLQMRNISKSFGAAQALRGVSLSVKPGEIHALMGENGAGKSTLIKVLAGAHAPDRGSEILIDGRPVAFSGPMAARAEGVAVIYQELVLAPNLTVAQNIFLGREPRRLGMADHRAMRAGATEVLQRLGADFTAERTVDSLTLAQRQMVEIARALHGHSRILVMDEPTTSLSHHESEILFAIMRRLRDEGLAIIYVSHRMEEVFALSDRISVLRDGGYVGTLERADAKPDVVVQMMVGRDPSGFYKKSHGYSRGQAVLTVRGLGDGHRVKGCDLDLYEGEVLGLAGLVGAGRTELARLIVSADPRRSGSISLDGRALNLKSPEHAGKAGIVYLSEDRKGLGLFLDMSVSENINLSVYGRDAVFGSIISGAKAAARVDRTMNAFNIRAANAELSVGSLSGGNQQKVLLARLLETRPRVVLLDEPTRGVDVGAKSEIYRTIDALAKAGVAVLVISSELSEIAGICDRVLIMREGRIAGALGGPHEAPIDQEAIVRLATAEPTEALSA